MTHRAVFQKIWANNILVEIIVTAPNITLTFQWLTTKKKWLQWKTSEYAKLNTKSWWNFWTRKTFAKFKKPKARLILDVWLNESSGFLKGGKFWSFKRMKAATLGTTCWRDVGGWIKRHKRYWNCYANLQTFEPTKCLLVIAMEMSARMNYFECWVSHLAQILVHTDFMALELNDFWDLNWKNIQEFRMVIAPQMKSGDLSMTWLTRNSWSNIWKALKNLTVKSSIRSHMNRVSAKRIFCKRPKNYYLLLRFLISPTPYIWNFRLNFKLSKEQRWGCFMASIQGSEDPGLWRQRFRQWNAITIWYRWRQKALQRRVH